MILYRVIRPISLPKTTHIAVRFFVKRMMKFEVSSSYHRHHILLKMIDKTEYERLNTIKAKEEILQDLIVILNANWNMRFQHILKSLKNV